MFYLDYHVSTQMCRLRDAFMRMFARYKTSVCTLFWLTKICLCVTFSIWHNLFHLTTYICSRNDVPPLEFNLRTLLCIRLLTHETMSENIGFTDSKDSVHCKKNVPVRHFLIYVVMCVCKFWHTNPCLCAVSNIIFIASSNVACLYKLYQLWDVTMCNFFD